MNKLKAYVKLLRIKHYIKNGLVLLPLVFSGQLLQMDSMTHAIAGFVSFCLVSSAVYILNDIQDVEKDRQHPTKCKRPIASGAIPVPTAWVVWGICLLLAVGIGLLVQQPLVSYAALLAYFILNVGYSMAWKNVPLLEIAILVSGFLIRLLYGSLATGIPVSGWLFLTVISISFYLGFGKRRNEWRMQQKMHSSDTRKVLEAYTESFLNRSMGMFLCMSIVFYALWAVNHDSQVLLWSVPLVMLGALRYSMDVEGMDASGDPIEMIYGDKVIWLLGILSVVVILFGVYGG
ncbi:MAG: decaprenyl-phosphate phosphoribosyltransferase [Lachnospiraceae bacterium]|nr:decaprenyl-phosphate phosphoribosyltransferase [Lachnospiraceae bacterium]